jgi:hypothetical protein
VTRKSDKNAHLLVEGKNDQHVIWALCALHQVPETFDVLVPGDGGVDAVLADMPIRLKEAGLQALGVVIDADEDIRIRWQSLRNRLQQAGYSLPSRLSPNGFAASPSKRPRIGIWIMPDNRLPGVLENFVTQLIPANDPLKLVAEDTLQSIEQKRLHRYQITHRPKALIHTWLAWQEAPGMPMGQAITARVLQYNASTATRFVNWLRRLFVE